MAALLLRVTSGAARATAVLVFSSVNWAGMSIACDSDSETGPSKATAVGPKPAKVLPARTRVPMPPAWTASALSVAVPKSGASDWPGTVPAGTRLAACACHDDAALHAQSVGEIVGQDGVVLAVDRGDEVEFKGSARGGRAAGGGTQRAVDGDAAGGVDQDRAAGAGERG